MEPAPWTRLTFSLQPESPRSPSSTLTSSPRVLRTSLTYRKPKSVVAVGLRVHSAQVVGSMHEVPNKACRETCFDQSNGACRLVGICTGYGPKGHFLSVFLAEQFPKSLFRKSARKDLDTLKATLAQTYAECVRKMKEVRGHMRDSGVCVMAVLITENALVSLNVGDGRAVIARVIGGIWGLYQLVWGEKPELSVFHKRTLGRLTSKQISPTRNTLKSSQSAAILPRLHHKSPRKSVRLSPELTCLTLTSSDRFLILASPGLWDVVGSMEAVRMVQSLWPEDLESAPETVATEAERRWRSRGPKARDVTVLLVQFLS